QINDFNASVLGKFEKDMSEEAKTRQQEIDIAYMSRAVNRDITAQFREPVRSRWNIFANSMRSIGDIFGAQKVLEFDDLDDDLKAEFESAETDADKRRIYQEQALRVRADRRR